MYFVQDLDAALQAIVACKSKTSQPSCISTHRPGKTMKDAGPLLGPLNSTDDDDNDNDNQRQRLSKDQTRHRDRPFDFSYSPSCRNQNAPHGLRDGGGSPLHRASLRVNSSLVWSGLVWLARVLAALNSARLRPRTLKHVLSMLPGPGITNEKSVSVRPAKASWRVLAGPKEGQTGSKTRSRDCQVQTKTQPRGGPRGGPT